MNEPDPRPEHPDYWLLEELVKELDALTAEPKKMQEFIAAIVDPASVQYMAASRALRLYIIIQGAPVDPKDVLAAMYYEGFVIGAEYGRRTTEERLTDGKTLEA